ncbi:MAG: SpoIIE family protein phosphatase [Planctomycetales bacterium]|nr:SpoIIE family protein phosphatase [Planctomycetales bacterium]
MNPSSIEIKIAMALRRLENYLPEITERLLYLDQSVRAHKALRHQNSHIEIEVFFRDLLNLVFDWKLTNANRLFGRNQDSFDLSDTAKGIAVQVTVTTDAAKIRETLTKFIEKYDKDFCRLVFVYPFIEISNSTANFDDTLNGFDFDPKRDRFSFGHLLSETQDMKIERQKEVCLFLRSEIRLPGEKGGEANFQFDYGSLITAEDGECPYVGLRSFGKENASLFFGRESITQQLVARIQRGVAGDHSRILAVVGQSGCGKSSIVHAGVVPSIQSKASGITGPIIAIKPGSDPIDRLAAGLIAKLELPANASSFRDIAAELRGDERTLSRLLQLSSHIGEYDGNTIVFVDQFEELFTLCVDRRERNSFIDNLVYASTLARGQGIIILTLRADHYGSCSEHSTLAQLLPNHNVLIGAMTDDELRVAIEQPAKLSNCVIERGLTERLITDLNSRPGSLPLLQHTLQKLWENRSGQLLTHECYDSIGGLHGALEQYANEIYDLMSESQRSVCRDILLRLVRSEIGGTDVTRCRATFENLVPANQQSDVVAAVLERLINARLVSVDSTQINKHLWTVEIVHETLAQNWTRFQEWISLSRTFLSKHQRLSEASDDWRRGDFDSDYLLGQKQLEDTFAWARQHWQALTTLEIEFLEKSQEYAVRSQHIRELSKIVRRKFGSSGSVEQTLPIVLRMIFKAFANAELVFAAVATDVRGFEVRWVGKRSPDDRSKIKIEKLSGNMEMLNEKHPIFEGAGLLDDSSGLPGEIQDYTFMRSIMCVPMADMYGKPFAILRVESGYQASVFTSEDLDYLNQIVSLTTETIEQEFQKYDRNVRQELERDLQLAADVQIAFLPQRPPDVQGFRVSSFYQAANHIGGDYFDYIDLGNGQVGVVVADVVGHGVAAAMFMAKLSAETRYCLASEQDIVKAIEKLNDRMSELNVERFVTFLLVVIDPMTDRLTIVNAGHLAPMIRDKHGTITEVGEEESGLPIAIDSGVVYEAVDVEFEIGDVMLIFTDGINEAMNANDEEFGFERVRDLFREGGDADAVKDRVVQSVRDHVGSAPPFDDMCLIVIERTIVAVDGQAQ